MNNMKVLVTGSKGFIGKHVCLALKQLNISVLEYDRSNTKDELFEFLNNSDFIVHLAGVMRPSNISDFYTVNSDLTTDIANYLTEHSLKTPIIFSSSIQSALNNDYGVSKLQAENTLFKLQESNGNKVFVFRLTNAFGKWSKPNYNSVVSTFCYNISHGIDISISDPLKVINFIYIDDIVRTFVDVIFNSNKYKNTETNSVYPQYPVSLGDLAGLLYGFKNNRNSFNLPDVSNPFVAKLYATYLSYLDTNDFAYDLVTHKDNRGSFTELLKCPLGGQVSVNIIKPDVVKGNHWHHTKNEKFIVVSGECLIKFRKIDSSEIIEYKTNGENMKVVDIPTGYTHSIQNISNVDAVVVMWASELFDKDNPDTYYEEV